MKMYLHATALLFSGCFICCNNNHHTNVKSMPDAVVVNDPHSCAIPSEAVVKHLDLDITVDFDKEIISGKATYTIANHQSNRIYFDTRNMDIQKIMLADTETTFQLGEEKDHLGSSLEVAIKPSTSKLTIYYASRPGAQALQWLTAQQTANKNAPFLFTQSQAILARTWVPCQDSPGIRFTYNATVKVPEGLMALMSATNPTEKSPDGVYYFTMEQPIPAYLLALAVGDIEFLPIGNRTGVYAESGVVEKAAWEFADMENMLLEAEKLYGEYQWDRYDVIVLPPSFPFGGMENPRLTFATPTILAGDRSLTALIAHELAHSWSGNLVTNATWNDFWLNEGFTVYFEHRIMEALYGRGYSEMLASLGVQGLEETIHSLGAESPDTHLKLFLDNRDPDEGVTNVAYDKGYLFLRMLEEKVGRETWDQFLKTYFSEFAFQTMTTEQFLIYLEENLFNTNENVAWDKNMINKWIYGPGLPEQYPDPKSDKFTVVEQFINKWKAGDVLSELSDKTSDWTTHEWLHFLNHLGNTITVDDMLELDQVFDFTHSGNNEILCVWLTMSVNTQYEPAYESLEQFLSTIGRRKFLMPLYKAMLNSEEGRKMADRIYRKARPGYHYVSVASIDELLDWNSGV